MDEQAATTLAHDRADKSAKLAEILDEAAVSLLAILKPLSEKTEFLVNDIFDSEGNNQIKESLVKDLLANHEETKVKKAKAQEIVLAVIQDPNSDNELSSASPMDTAASYLAYMQNLDSEEIERE